LVHVASGAAIFTAPSCCITASYCQLSATLQTISIIVVKLQDNWAVFWIFIALLMFSFDSASYNADDSCSTETNAIAFQHISTLYILWLSQWR
jgi:hypothetical protein